VVYLHLLGLRDVAGVDAAQALAFMMHQQHHRPHGRGAQPAATDTPAASGAPAQAAGPERPNKAASDSPLARTGASLSAGALALALLVVGGYLILRRRQQVN